MLRAIVGPYVPACMLSRAAFQHKAHFSETGVKGVAWAQGGSLKTWGAHVDKFRGIVPFSSSFVRGSFRKLHSSNERTMN